MIRRFVTLLWFFPICINLIVLVGCVGSPPDLVTMVEQVRPGVVRIDSYYVSGSGIIFDTTSEGGALVLTNYHVVDGAGRINVKVEDSDTYRGYLQGFDAEIDLAVVSICCGKFEKLSFGDVSKLKPGSDVVAIGYPLGLLGAASITRGVVSAIRLDGGLDGYTEVIQMDAPLNPGNSGGPLLSASGEVLGINTYTIGTEGLGFAVSEREVQIVLPELRGESSFEAARPRPTLTPKPTATPSLPLVKLTAISCGSRHTCGLRPDGTPVCWGSDEDGQASPPAGERFTSISSGQVHTCGLRSDGTPVCWGAGGSSTVVPPAGERFTSISVGSFYACGLRSDGTPVCWGLGSSSYGAPPEGEKFTFISTGLTYTCGLRSDGTAVCWGGHPLFEHKLRLPQGERFTSISTGWDFACALRPDGTPLCWGDDRLGHVNQRFAPARERLISISTGGLFNTCGLRSDGTPVCWSWLSNPRIWTNEIGRLPKQKFISISSGSHYTCGLRADRTPVCWSHHRFFADEDFGQASPPTVNGK